MLSKKRIQIYVLVLDFGGDSLPWTLLLQEPMGHLGIKYTVTVDLVLADKGTSVFAEIMKHFDNISIF
jgi:hypothetical protein